MSIIHHLRRLKTNYDVIGGLGNRKPRLLRKMVQGYVRSLFTRRPRLRFMDIALSYTCNFSCQHCSAESLKKETRKLLGKQEYRRLAREAMSAGVLAFHFTGGEPLLKDDLLEIIGLFEPAENLISIQTNAWKLNADFLDQYRKTGGDIVCISMDSPRSEEHDNFRQQRGSWKKALEGIRLSVLKGFQVLMSYTLTHDSINSPDFAEMIDLADQEKTTLSLYLAVPAGKWQGNLNYLLTKDDRKKLNKIIRKYPYVRTDFESNWRIRGCPAFKEKCYLSPYGDVLPCPFIHISFGNIKKESLHNIRQKALAHAYMNTYHPVCIAAEDRHFIEHAGCYNVEDSLLPISPEQSGILQRECGHD